MIYKYINFCIYLFFLLTVTVVDITQPSALSLSTTYTIPPCDSPSGTIEAQGSGGTLPYQFSINGNVSSSGHFGGLLQGNYSVTVTDKNLCTAQQTVIVKLYTNDIQAIAYSQPVLCYGYPLYFCLSFYFTMTLYNGNTGSISIQTTGTYAPFQYQVFIGTSFSFYLSLFY